MFSYPVKQNVAVDLTVACRRTIREIYPGHLKFQPSTLAPSFCHPLISS